VGLGALPRDLLALAEGRGLELAREGLQLRRLEVVEELDTYQKIHTITELVAALGEQGLGALLGEGDAALRGGQGDPGAAQGGVDAERDEGACRIVAGKVQEPVADRELGGAAVGAGGEGVADAVGLGAGGDVLDGRPVERLGDHLDDVLGVDARVDVKIDPHAVLEPLPLAAPQHQELLLEELGVGQDEGVAVAGSRSACGASGSRGPCPPVCPGAAPSRPPGRSRRAGARRRRRCSPAWAGARRRRRWRPPRRWPAGSRPRRRSPGAARATPRSRPSRRSDRGRCPAHRCASGASPGRRPPPPSGG
jgi:hypothetical protein